MKTIKLIKNDDYIIITTEDDISIKINLDALQTFLEDKTSTWMKYTII